MLNGHQPLPLLVRIMFCIFPFITNLCFIIFIGCSITNQILPSEARNSIAITSIFIIYAVEVLMVFMYGKCMGSWSELFYGVADNPFLDFMLIITHPVFFIFYLPLIIYRLMQFTIGLPNRAWERVFGTTVMSLINLKCGNGSACAIFVRLFYIGIPFVIFSIVYLAIFIVFTPLWLFTFSPIGMGMYSICLAISFQLDSFKATTIEDRVERTYRWGLFLNVFVIALLGFLCSACYIGLVGAHFHAILLLCVSGVYFLCGCIPAIRGLFCSQESICP